MSPQPKRGRDAGDSAEQQDEGSAGGGYLADPNREAVGVEPAWAEGSGGSDTSGGSGPTRRKPEPAPEPEPEPEPEARTSSRGKGD